MFLQGTTVWLADLSFAYLMQVSMTPTFSPFPSLLPLLLPSSSSPSPPFFLLSSLPSSSSPLPLFLPLSLPPPPPPPCAIQTAYFDILVPTIDTQRYGFLTEKLLDANRSVLFTGTTGVGKVCA